MSTRGSRGPDRDGGTTPSRRGDEPEDARRGLITPLPHDAAEAAADREMAEEAAPDREMAEAAADREMAEAEHSVAAGTADEATAARVAALDGARTHEQRRHRWMRTSRDDAAAADTLVLVHEAVTNLGRVVAAGPSQRGGATTPPSAASGSAIPGHDRALSGEVLAELAELAELIGPATMAVVGTQSAEIAHHSQALSSAVHAHRRALNTRAEDP